MVNFFFLMWNQEYPLNYIYFCQASGFRNALLQKEGIAERVSHVPCYSLPMHGPKPHETQAVINKKLACRTPEIQKIL